MDSSIFPTPNVTQSHPWLVLFKPTVKGQQEQVFYSLQEGRYYGKKISEMHNKRIFTNRKEWLVIVDYYTNECCLLNVVSMEKVKLPKLESCHFNYSCPFLTSAPGDPNCRVIFITGGTLDHKLSLCQPGDDKFIDKEIVLSEEEDEYLRWATIYNGSIYGVGDSTYSLFRAHLNDTTLQFQTVFQGESIQNNLLDDRHHGYLIESCGELLLVIRYCLHYDISNFQVFRADFSTLKWVIMTSIGDRALFLEGGYSSYGLSCSVSESDQIQGNSIYYTEPRNRLLYVFNLENRSFTSSLPCPTIDRKIVIRQWIIIPQTSVFCDDSKS